MAFKCIFVFLVICVVTSQCTRIEDEVNNSTQFTLDWYRNSFDANKNTVVSPISFRILLSLLYQSTIGDTEHELQQSVYLSEKHNTAVSQRLTIDKLMESPNVKIVNKIYIRQGAQLKADFLAKSLEYHSGIEQKDFHQAEQVRNEINQFVEEQTNSLIKELIAPGIIQESTALLLLNTLYFKAKWATQFNVDLLKRHFTGIDNLEYNIDFMFKTTYFNLHQCPHLDGSVLELPYVPESNAKLWVILPNNDTNIHDLHEKLNVELMNKIPELFERKRCEVYLPKFEIENEIEGNSELRKLGLNSMFDKTEIAAFEDGSLLQVSDAKQKVKIIVNTEGTEAAAATYIVSRYSSARITEDPIVLSFDRPFIYILMVADTNEPLFIGHYSKPESQYLVN